MLESAPVSIHPLQVMVRGLCDPKSMSYIRVSATQKKQCTQDNINIMNKLRKGRHEEKGIEEIATKL